MESKYMDKKRPSYYIEKIIDDIVFSIKCLENVSSHEFNKNEVLNSAISFKFIQISENVKMIPKEITNMYSEIPWNKINGLRNKIVHDYGNVQMDIIYDTVKKDLPILLKQLKSII